MRDIPAALLHVHIDTARLRLPQYSGPPVLSLLLLASFLWPLPSRGAYSSATVEGTSDGTPHPAAVPDTSRCHPLTWREPQAIHPPGALRPVVVSAFTRSRQGDAVLVGNEVDTWGQRLPRGSLVALRPDGELLGRPPGGHHWLAYPRGAFDGNGLFHLVWGDPRPQDLGPAHWALLHVGSLWHATYQPGLGWSPSDKVYEHPSLAWSPALGTLRAGADGVVRLVVPVRPDSLAQFRQQQGTWQQSGLRAPGASYSDMLTSADGRVVLAYVGTGQGAPHAPPSAGNSVFVTASTDGGATWRPPTQVQLSTEGRAVDLHLLGVPGGPMFLVWGQALSGGGWAAAIRIVQSTDGGVTWSPPRDLSAAYGSFAAAITPIGDVHVVWNASGTGDSHFRRLMHSCYRAQWSSPDTLFADTIGRGLTPALSVMATGDLQLAWTRASNPDDPSHTSAVMWAEATYPHRP